MYRAAAEWCCQVQQLEAQRQIDKQVVELSESRAHQLEADHKNDLVLVERSQNQLVEAQLAQLVGWTDVEQQVDSHKQLLAASRVFRYRGPLFAISL